MNYCIFKGRFQPFHNGHLQIVERAISMLDKNDILVLAAMCPFDYPVEVVDKEFSERAEEHRLPERNPWGSTVALEAISEVSKQYANRHKIITTLMPYPNLAWPVVKNWFPKNRIWIIPDSGEEFDNIKADFYVRQGEYVIRILDDTGISGKELREYFQIKATEKFLKGIPDFLHKIYAL